MKKSLLAVGILTLVLLLFTVGLFFAPNESVNSIFEGNIVALSLGSTVVQVALADTEQTRRQGLSDLKFLPQGHGLFFVFQEENMSHGIWMKDMKFSIDILWFDSNMEVVYISRNVSPESYPNVFYSKTPARFVLEVEAGFSFKHDIEIGSVGIFKEL